MAERFRSLWQWICELLINEQQPRWSLMKCREAEIFSNQEVLWVDLRMGPEGAVKIFHALGGHRLLMPIH
jgi:hypothetical protein